jgi:rubrerythrin
MVTLSEKEKSLVQDMQDQEALCMEKYRKYAEEARDTVLKNLFSDLRREEETHYQSLAQLLEGTVPQVNTNDTAGKNYSPTATYAGCCSEEDKNHDAFLCTDAITTEKYVASAYNFDLFQFGNSDVRRLLNDIETEEQNHAEKLYKYKVVNQMAQ